MEIGMDMDRERQRFLEMDRQTEIFDRWIETDSNRQRQTGKDRDGHCLRWTTVLLEVFSTNDI